MYCLWLCFSFDLSPWSVNQAVPIATQMIICPFLGTSASLTPDNLLSLNGMLFSRMFTGVQLDRMGAVTVALRN